MKIIKLYRTLSSIVFHTAIILFSLFLPLYENAKHTKYEILFQLMLIFLSISAIMYISSSVIIVILLKRKLKFYFLQSFIICYLASLPFYGPFYYRKKILAYNNIDISQINGIDKQRTFIFNKKLLAMLAIIIAIIYTSLLFYTFYEKKQIQKNKLLKDYTEDLKILYDHNFVKLNNEDKEKLKYGISALLDKSIDKKVYIIYAKVIKPPTNYIYDANLPLLTFIIIDVPEKVFFYNYSDDVMTNDFGSTLFTKKQYELLFRNIANQELIWYIYLRHNNNLNESMPFKLIKDEFTSFPVLEVCSRQWNSLLLNKGQLILYDINKKELARIHLTMTFGSEDKEYLQNFMLLAQ